MNETQTVNRKETLNLQVLNYYLTKEIHAAGVADNLDALIFDFMYAVGEAGERLVMPLKTINDHVYQLTKLRNVFLNVSIANNEPFELGRIINDCAEY